MPTAVSLIYRGVGHVTLIADIEHEFLDAAGTFTGRRHPPRKRQTQSMVNPIQNLPYDLTVDLVNPDGTPFNLTGATTIRVSVFATTPLQQTIVITAGSAGGAPTDGRVLFALPGVNFSGFAEGEVEVVKAGRTHGFEKLPFKFDLRRST